MQRRTKFRRLAFAAVVGGALVGSATPALAGPNPAAVPITYSLSTGCSTCRTLELANQDGTSPLSGLNLSSGTNGFIANVVDSGLTPSALGTFSVGATMSNLYGYNQSTSNYDCSTVIPSSAVSLNSAPALLTASGLSASVQPALKITGDLSQILTSTLTALLPGVSVVTNPVITANGQTDTAISQAIEAGASAPSILGGSLLGAAGLPLSLATGTGGAFTAPAAPPSSSCSGNGTGATTIPVLNGALASGNPLLADAQSVVGNPTVTQLISEGYLDASTAETLISGATNISTTYLDSTLVPWSGVLASIENKLTATVTGLVSGGTTLTGTYGADPVMTVSAPTTATPATYQGVLTVTLTSP